MISFGVDTASASGAPLGAAELPPVVAPPGVVNLVPIYDVVAGAGDLPPAPGLVGLNATLPYFAFRPGDPTGAALGIGNAGGGGNPVGLLVTVALLALLLYLASRKW